MGKQKQQKALKIKAYGNIWEFVGIGYGGETVNQRWRIHTLPKRWSGIRRKHTRLRGTALSVTGHGVNGSACGPNGWASNMANTPSGCLLTGPKRQGQRAMPAGCCPRWERAARDYHAGTCPASRVTGFRWILQRQGFLKETGYLC